MPQWVVSGGTAFEPTTVLAGHEFAGWFTEPLGAGTRWAFSTPITANITLHAHWQLALFEVTFNTGSADTPTFTQNVRYRDLIVRPPDPVRNLFIFNGWHRTPSTAATLWNFETDTMPAGDLELFARWTPTPEIAGPWTIQFDTGGGEFLRHSIPAITGIVGGTVLNAPAAPVWPGGAFTGWFSDAERTQPFDWSQMIISDHTVYLGWDYNFFNIVFDADGGTPMPESQNIMFGNLVTQPTVPTRSGYVFSGWFTDPARTQGWQFEPAEQFAVRGNMTLYALWQPAVTVTFNSQGGSEVPAATIVRGTTLEEPYPAPTRFGYRLAGWSQHPTVNVPWNFDTPVVADLSLYAVWRLGAAIDGDIVRPAGSWSVPARARGFGFPLFTAEDAPPISGFSLFINVDPSHLSFIGARKGGIIDSSIFSFTNTPVQGVDPGNRFYPLLNDVKDTGRWFSIGVVASGMNATTRNGELIVPQFEILPGMPTVGTELTFVWGDIHGLDAAGDLLVDWKVDTGHVAVRNNVFLGQIREPNNPQGRVTTADATLALRAAMDVIELTGDSRLAADIYADGRPITSSIATQILRYAMMIINTLPETR
jgi:uncharacterized repeat protein (TIGR02543 family)